MDKLSLRDKGKALMRSYARSITKKVNYDGLVKKALKDDRLGLINLKKMID